MSKTYKSVLVIECILVVLMIINVITTELTFVKVCTVITIIGTAVSAVCFRSKKVIFFVFLVVIGYLAFANGENLGRFVYIAFH